MAQNRQQFTLQFNADTTQAKRQIEDIMRSLQKVTAMNHIDLGLRAEIMEAADAADALGQHLKNATNFNTGKINLNDFAKSIEMSGHSMSDLISKLANGGEVGQQAFMKLTTAISQSQIPLKQTSKLIESIGTTLKNTVKWELSSNAVHGLESALSGAVSYVKNLNSSLNDIRIVAGYSEEHMRNFAIQANKAAKELSTTTKAYADASLIYYQQGDTQEQVAKKAAITIKAANASFGTSASEMSEYLTSVWNSYQVGANELERYVDIMAALGAKTATSLEEIATSMQKVAATANTVGVSMEQVSSIISTVSSVTRESAESIGTSYKTIFARIGDLKLGGTTEDGIGLGQVSSQLESIGVKILDTQGNLREMGDIITDLGNKWQYMTEAQKTAIAQVVAGKRQYTQLMALFENWDMYNQNLNIANNADGSLQEMADIYAESWEAASARAKAAMEDLYSSLLNDKLFIGLTNTFAELLNVVDTLVESFGGGFGVLATLGGVLLNLYGTRLTGAIKDLGANVAKLFVNPKKEYAKNLAAWKEETENSATGTNSQSIAGVNKVISLKTKLLSIEDSLSTKQKEYMSNLIDGVTQAVNKVQEMESAYNESSAALKQTTRQMAELGSKSSTAVSAIQQFKTTMKGIQDAGGTINDNWIESLGANGGQTTQQKVGQITSAYTNNSVLMGVVGRATNAYGTGGTLDAAASLTSPVEGASEDMVAASAKTKAFQTVLEEISTAAEKAGIKLTGMLEGINTAEGMKKLAMDLATGTQSVDQLKTELGNLMPSLQQNDQAFTQFFQKLAQGFPEGSAEAQELRSILSSLTDGTLQSEEDLRRLAQRLVELGAKAAEAESKMEKLKTANLFAEVITQGVSSALQAFSSLNAMVNSVKNTFLVFANSSSTFSDKLGAVISILTALGGAVMLGASMWKVGMTLIEKTTKTAANGVSTAIISIPILGWIIGIVEAIVILGGLIAGLFGANEQKEKEQQEKLAELEKAKEEARLKRSSANKEEIQQNASLLKSFEDLLAQKRAGKDVDKDLYQSSLNLISVYGLTGASLDALAGNYEAVAEAARESIKAQNEAAMKQAQLDVQAQKNYVRTYIVSSDNLNYKTNGNITGNIYNESSDDDTFSKDGAQATAQNRTWQTMGYMGGTAGKNLQFSYLNLDTSTSNMRSNDTKWVNSEGKNLWAIMEDSGFNKYLASTYGDKNGHLLVSKQDTFEYRQNMFQDLEKLLYGEYQHMWEGLEDTSMYQRLVEYYNSVKDQFSTYASLTQNVKDSASATLDACLIGIIDIKTWDEYESIYTQMVEWATDNAEALGVVAKKGSVEFNKQIDNIVHSILSTSSETSKYALVQSAALEKFGNSTGKETLMQAIGDIVNAYGPEAITNDLLTGILMNYDKYVAEYESEEGFIESLGIGTDEENPLISLSKAKGTQATNKSRTNAVKDLKNSMSEDMTTNQIAALAKDALNWGSKGIIEYTDFLAMTYQEQMAYLKSLSAEGAKIMYEDAVALAQAAEKAAEEYVVNDADKGNYDDWSAQETQWQTYVGQSWLKDANGKWTLEGKEQQDNVDTAILKYLNNGGTLEGLTSTDVQKYILGDSYITLDKAGTTYKNSLDFSESLTATAKNSRSDADLAFLNYMNEAVLELSNNMTVLAKAAGQKPTSLADWYELYYVYDSIAKVSKDIDDVDLATMMNWDNKTFSENMVQASKANLTNLQQLGVDGAIVSGDYASEEAFQAALAEYNKNAGSKNPIGETEFLETQEGSMYKGKTLISGGEQAQLIYEQRQSIQAGYENIFNTTTQGLDVVTSKASRLTSLWNSIDLNAIPAESSKLWQQLSKDIGGAQIAYSDFAHKTKEEQIDFIAEQKKANINAQIGDAASGYTQLRDLAGKYAVDETLSAEARAYWAQKQNEYNEKILDLELEAGQIDQDVLNQKTEIYEKDFAKSLQTRSREIARLKKEAEQLKSLTDSLKSGLDSGELSNEAMKQMADKGYGTSSDWYKSAQNRAKIVAKATTASYAAEADAFLKEQEVYDKLNTTWIEGLTDDAALESAFANKAAFTSWIHNLSDLSDETKAVLSNMWSDINANLDGDFNATEIREAMKTAFAEAAAEGKISIEDLASSFRDSYLSIVAEMSAAEQQAAQDACDAWLNAFNLIKEARQGLLSGKSLAEQYTGDVDSIYQLMLASGMNAADFRADFYGTGMTDKLKLSTWNTQDQLAARGTNLLTDSDGNKHTSWNAAYQDWFTQIGGEEALDDIAKTYINELGKTWEEASDEEKTEARGKAQTDLDTQFQSEMRDVLKTLFPEDTPEEIQNRLNKLMSGEGWDEVATQLNKFTTAVDLAGDSLTKMTEYDEAKIKRDRNVESAEAEVTKYQEQAAEQRGYADMAGNMYTKGKASVESVLGETYSSAGYLSVINEALTALGKENVESLDEVDHTTWGELQDYFLTQEHSLLDQAAEAGKKIVKAGETFATTVKTIFGEDSGSELITSAEEDLEEAEADQEDREEAAAAAEGGSTTASATRSDYDAQQYGFANTQEWDDYAQRLINIGEIVDENGEKVEELTDRERQLAAELKRTEKGFSDAENGLSNWTKDLKNANKSSDKYTKALKSMRTAYADIFNLADDDANMLSETFLESEENAKLLEKAIQGDNDAFNQLQANVAKEITAKIDVSLTGREEVDSFIDYVANYDFGDLKVGAKIDDENFNAQLDNMIFNSYDAASQMSDALSSMGVDATIKEHKVWVPDNPETVTVTGSVPIVSPTGVKGYESVSAEVVQQGTGHFETWYTLEGANYNGRGVSRGGSGSSSGGGGGGGKAKTIDKKKPEDEKERYHTVNKQLDRLTDELDKVDKFKSRAYGKSHLNNMSAEINLLKEQIGLQQKYLAEAKQWLAIDKQRVASMGATFDEDGNISNYEELMDSVLKKYNDFVDKYNAASASQQEKMEEEKEEWDEWYEERTGWISQYEETLALIYDKENELLELQNQISEKTLEKIQYKIEYKVEFNQSELDFLEYINDIYDETLEKQDLIMDNYVRQGQIAEQNLSYLATAKKELEAAYASGNLTSADYIQGLQDIQEQTLENLEAIQDVKESIDELYSNTLDLAGEQLDEHTAKIDSAAEAMKSYISILQLMGKGTNYEDLLHFYEKQYDYNVASLEAQVNYLNVLKEEEQYYLDRMNTAEGLTETERKQYEALMETLNDANSTMLSSTEEVLQNIKEMYDTTIESIVRKLEQSMTGMDKDLAWLTEEYSFYTEEMEQYVSASRELYEVSKLNRNIQNSINDTTSKVHKQKLKELQDEINAQSELKELSEYEIEMMNLKYELLLKQIALEEAQNAKSTVRLTRDSEGNMIYQYTADQDAINQAQQEYEDVLQQMSDLNYETENNIYSQTLQLRQETLDSIKEIAQNETLTEEQKQARIAEIMERYYSQAEYMQEQYGIVMENTTATNQLIAEHYGVAIETLSKNTQESIAAILGEMINSSDNYKTEMQMAYEEIKNAMQSYAEKVAEVTEITGTNYGNMIDSVKTYDEITNDATKETSNLTNELRKQVNQLHDSTSAWDAYYKKIQNVTKEYSDMYSAIQKTIAAQGQLANASAPSSIKTNTSTTKTANTDKTPISSSSSTSSGSGSGGSSSGGKTSGSSMNSIVAGTIAGAVASRGLSNDTNPLSRNYSKSFYLTKYASGGLADYTGPAWVDGTTQNPELVLNSSDTQNMLNIVDTVRRLDKTTLSMMDEFINLAASSMMSNLFQIHAGSASGNNQTELEQNVHITAEFPNVQDSNEIQDAFDNLVNRAAQYIGSKRK